MLSLLVALPLLAPALPAVDPLSAAPRIDTVPNAALPPEIEDPAVLAVGTEPHHSVLMPYATMAEAMRADRSRSTYARSLNGAWRFHWVKRPEERPVDFHRPGYDDSRWPTLPVPANWQVHGYGTPYYRNAGYTFRADPPRVAAEPPRDWTAYDERNPVGSYRRTFEVPAGWKGREVFLRFDGVDAGFFVWVNGEKVGYAQNSRNAAEFDVTPFLKPGKNDLAVEVYTYTAGSYFEDQDMFRLSGIFRNVTLWSAPKLHLRDTALVPDLDAAYRDGTLTVRAKIRNHAASPSKAPTLKVRLFDPAGRPVTDGAITLPPLAAGGEAAPTIVLPVAAPRKWSAEDPALYTAVLDLDGELVSHRVGFRKVEIRGRVFMVNGRPVKLKGANRHEMSPETGHAVTEADMVEDLKMLKRANCNHVRTSHYSNDPRWYELCDEWGIYLVAEANAECHGLYGTLDRDPRFEAMVVDRNVANVENFKNHPSVLIWSMGNECGGGSNLRAAEAKVRAMDPTRPTHYEAFGRGEGNPAGIDSHMYTDPAGTERIAQDPNLTKPFYLCEYAHAMNNSMGSIGEYNDLFDKYPALMGGAIWEWEDQGLWNRRDPKRPYLAYGGGFGEKPNDGYFIHKGVVFSDRTPKPHFPEVKRAYQWIGFEDVGGGTFRVRNRHAFTDLSAFDFRWSLVSDAGTVTTGAVPTFALAPGETREIRLNLPRIKLEPGTSVYLNVAATLRRDERWAPKGWEVANAQFPFVPGETPTRAIPSGDLLVDAGGSGLRVSGDGWSVVFDRATGTIGELSQGGRNVLLPGGGPRLHLWRAQHRNDDGWAAQGWRAAGLRELTTEVLAMSFERGPDREVIVSTSVRHVGRNGFAALHLATYTVYGDGTIAVDNAVSPSGPNVALARMGVRMLLDPGMSSLNYFARGPMENYADRKRGSDLGRYSGTVDAQMTPYEKPQENGNHEDLKWLSLIGKEGVPLVAHADRAPLQFSALPYRDEEMEDVPYRVDLPESKATVLILAAKTLGVGSAACGPRPLPEYRLDCEPRAFSYVLRITRPTKPLALPRRASAPPLVRTGKDGSVTFESAEGPVEVQAADGTWSRAETLRVSAPLHVPIRRGAFRGLVFVQPPPAKLSWRTSATSFERGEGETAHATDGDPDTFWHTRWSGAKDGLPQSLTVDLIRPTAFGHVVLKQRSGDNRNGRIRAYEIATSEDGETWETVARGELPDRDEPTSVALGGTRTRRYVRLTALSDWGGRNLASLAEFDVAP